MGFSPTPETDGIRSDVFAAIHVNRSSASQCHAGMNKSIDRETVVMPKESASFIFSKEM
jgi:hypothetical protein